MINFLLLVVFGITLSPFNRRDDIRLKKDANRKKNLRTTLTNIVYLVFQCQEKRGNFSSFQVCKEVQNKFIVGQSNGKVEQVPKQFHHQYDEKCASSRIKCSNYHPLHSRLELEPKASKQID